MTKIHIALDAMGGDHGPEVVVPAGLAVLAKRPELHLIYVGDKPTIESILSRAGKMSHERISIHHTTQVVGMDEKPSFVLRGKKDSSMRVAINLVKEGKAQACVSAGNTGALMATARFVLRMLPGIDRPAIVYALPSLKGPVAMLDLGANVDCLPEHLYQFAVMGTILVQTLHHKTPTVGLLNVGQEAIKGNETVKKAAELLSQADTIQYVGFIEGDDIYKGTVDVVVCDGFVGNVSLKTSEGLLAMILHTLKREFTKSLWRKIVSLLAMPVLKSLYQSLDPNQYNGATLLGLQGVVIKSHGGANQSAFAIAIETALKEAEQDLPQRIKHTVAERLHTGEA